MKTSFLSWTMALVAASALIACGDDTGTGTGGSSGQGGNGDGGDGTTTAGPTTTSGATTTASTTTTSSTGGDGGGGGDTTSQGGAGGTGGGDGGAGGESPCEQVEMTDVAYDGANAAFVGLVDPSIGEAGEDYGFLFFTNEVQTVDIADLPEPLTDGVIIGEDVDPDTGNFTGSFFLSTEGVIDVAADGWSVTGLRLVELDEEGEPLVDGRCLDVADFSGELAAPIGFVCNASFYDADDGCDCVCGIIDPDCEDPEARVWGCEPDQTCADPEATCEGDVVGCDNLPEIVLATTAGTTIGGDTSPFPSCWNDQFGAAGLSQAYVFASDAAGEYTITVNAASDHLVSIRTACDDISTELACADATASGDEEIVVELAADTEYTILVGAYAGAEAVFSLTVAGP